MTYAPTWSFYLDSKPWELSRQLYMRHLDRETGRAQVVAPFVFTDLENPGGIPTDSPALTERGMSLLMPTGQGDLHQFLQAAMDLAWKEGLRPEGFSTLPDATAELTAVRYHLEDMRTLAKLR